ncbi:MAG: radical SAM protein [Candidatus Electrothrix communis]|nr:MAG: radical SAM protein [Candidatus Electrothrix communis]
MRLERLTLLRPNMGDFRAGDGLPPLSLAILAARTPSEVEISLYDDRIEEIPKDDQPDLVAMTVETFTARRAYALADRYRAQGVPVVMGGFHPTFLPDEALNHADAVVTGDAEGSWEELLADFQEGRLKRRYSGGNARSLDDFVLDRSIFQGKKYPPVEVIQYGRGCRFSCDFCSIHAFYQDNRRVRSVDNVLDELRKLRSKKLFFFVDDNLFASGETLEALLVAVRPLQLKWACQISIDAARDERLLDRMAEAGCMSVLIGFESLSPANLRQMGKSWNQAVDGSSGYAGVVHKFHQRGMAVYGTFVFGYDDDTLETIRKTVEFALEAGLEVANFNPLTPTPGTPLYEWLEREQRLLSPRWWLDPDYRYGDPIFIPKQMDPAEFAEQCFQARKTFYSWPNIARRVVLPDAGFSWFRSGMVGLVNIVSRREIFRKQYKKLGN